MFVFFKNRIKYFHNNSEIKNFSDIIKPSEILSKIKSSGIGFTIEYLEKTDSTNSVARDMADNGADEGTIVLAEEQTDGRGRLNRTWLSEPYKNILMSIILRPDIPYAKAFTLTMIASLAVVKAIKKITGLKAMIKWPNDIYFRNKKLAGILTELKVDKNKISFAVIGIGLNVNADISRHPEIRDTGTSLLAESGSFVSRNDLLGIILKEIGKEYSKLKSGKLKVIKKKWNRYSMVTGKAVKIIYADKDPDEGIALSVSEEGILVLLKDNNEKKDILCGDVMLRLTKSS